MESGGDLPQAWGLAQAGPPGKLAALPGTILPVGLPRTLALFLLLLFLLIIKLLDPVLVTYLEQVGIGLQGAGVGGRVGRAALPVPPSPTRGQGSTHVLIVSIEGEGDVGRLVERRARRESTEQ